MAAETPASAPSPAPERQAELVRLLRDDCGACHGMTLQGGLGSPLTSAALADKPRDGLVATVLQGRPGTAMPPWQPFMTQDEARWLIERLQSGHLPGTPKP
jgi:cytochrome c55X